MQTQTRGFASVSENPLDRKVEMTNAEKGNFINYKYVFSRFCGFRCAHSLPPLLL